MMFDFADRAATCLCRPWRFAIAGRDKLVAELTTYTSCKLYSYLTTIYIDMELLTADCTLLPIIVAFGLTDYVQMSDLGHIFGGCNCSVVVD